MLLRRITAATLALAIAATLSACDDDDDDDDGVGPGTQNTTVRFVNASTTADFDFDVTTGGTVGTGNGDLDFGETSSCIRVNNQTHGLAVRPTGGTTNLTGFNPTFAANGRYTVIVTGTDAAPVFTQLTDQFTTPAAGRALVRIVNATSAATANAASWDVYMNPGATLGTPNATNVARNAGSTFIDVPAGATTVRLTTAGSTTTGVQNITLGTLTAGTVRTVVVTDAATGSTALRTINVDACTT